MENIKYWSGSKIDKLAENEVFVFGSNPQGIHGAGGAKSALGFGAQVGNGRGIQGQSFAIVTKSLNAGYLEKSTGILYDKSGYCSVSEAQIKSNIDELYKYALNHPEKSFLITYQFETWPNGTPKKSLNGYTSQEMLEMFLRDNIPPNIVFHDSYRPHLEKLLKKTNNGNETQPIKDNSPISFTKVSLPNGWMSNMAPYPVIHNEIQYKTTEALFQCLRFLNYPQIQKEIREQNSPMAAKMVAKANKHLLINDGYELLGKQDVENMRFCIDLKLAQHPELKNILIDTENRTIIEDCSARPQESGLFWGAAYQNGKWVGENVLGHILMDKRQELINKLEGKVNMQNKPQEYTFFFHLTSPFSNFHPAKFEYKEYTFISNEQFMMFSKAKQFNDEETASKIIALNNNQLAKDFIEGKVSREEIVKDKDLCAKWQSVMMDAKKLGRGVKNYDDEIWNRKRSKIVLFGARLKFTQNLDLKEIILQTGNTKMVEASPYDKIWGIGLSEFDAKKVSEDKWPGLNLLGKVLDELKIEFNNELVNDNSIKKKDKAIEVVNFYHINKQIPEDGEYMGRYNKNFNLPASIFANPFPVYKPEDRGSSIGKYTEWLWKQIADENITKKDLLALRGKKLVCYCAPLACHSNVVKDTVELLINNEAEFDIKVKEYQMVKKFKP